MEVLNSVAARPVGVENNTQVQQVQQAQVQQQQTSQTSSSVANNTSSLTPVRSDNLASASALSVSADIAFSVESQNGSTSVSGNVSVNVRFANQGNQPSEGATGAQINLELALQYAEASQANQEPTTSEQLIQGALDISQPVQGNRIESSIYDTTYASSETDDGSAATLLDTTNQIDNLNASTSLGGSLSDIINVGVNIEVTLPEGLNPPTIQPAGETVAQNAALAANPANVRAPDVSTVDIAV